VHPDVTTGGKYWQEGVAGLIAPAALDAASARIRCGCRVQTQPVRDSILKGQALGCTSRESSIVFPDGSSLIQVSLPIGSIPVRLVRSGGEEHQELGLDGPECLDDLVAQRVRRPVHDQIWTVCLERHAPAAEILKEKGRSHSTTLLRSGT
jgi:hypothetical protein